MDSYLLMQLFTYLIILLFGLVIGSFLNVVIYRYPRGESLILPRSSCVHCKTMLHMVDLIPLLSYIFLKGRCRYCGAPVSWRYPLVEFLTALIFLLSYLYLGLTPLFIKYVVILSMLLIISFIDLDISIIPNRLVLVLLLWSIAWQMIHPDISIAAAGIGLLAGGGLFFLIAVLSKGGMGGGDIKLMAVLGFTAGWPLVLVVFLLAFILGAAVGLALMVIGKKTRRDPIPFGPFISLSFLISAFWGVQIWQWYMIYL